MEPLRLLRHCCTVPKVERFNAERRPLDICMRPDEVQEHLVKKTDEGARTELRKVLYSLNRLGDLYIIKDQNGLAIEKYNAVLEYPIKYVDFAR